MPNSDLLIPTKLHVPFTRPELVSRPRLRARIEEGLRGPLTLVTAPAGFGKTTLVASSLANCGLSTGWLSLDRDDNQSERFLIYLVTALQKAYPEVSSQTEELLRGVQQAPPEAILTSLINDLDNSGREIVLVLDDYQFIKNQEVHDYVAFLLEHSPQTLHLVIVTRSDPPLPLTRLRARGQMVEFRGADLRFTKPEAAQFLNEVMGFDLDAGSIAVLEERTEGWIAGLQMAALSMRDRDDITGFIESFSGTNRYILDYLLEEVLTGLPEEIQRFLLYTSILERLNSSLCVAILVGDEDQEREGGALLAGLEEPRVSQSAFTLESLERANLFLIPLDDERQWYRYHHLFAELLRAQLRKNLGDRGITKLHLRAADWYEHNSFILEAIHHASMASDDEKVELLIKQHYMEMMNRGEMSWVRFWMGNLSKELILRRPWLCLFEAMNHSWFGRLEEANLILDEAEKRIKAEDSADDAQSMLAYHAYVKSRVTAMQGDNRQAIKYCLFAREKAPADSLDLQIDFSITLGYEYFLSGDFVNARKILNEMIRSGDIAGAVNNPVAGYCLLVRSFVYEGQLREVNELLEKVTRLIGKANGKYLGAAGLVEVEKAALLYERNELEAALACVTRSLEYLSWWGKADDFCLAHITLSRVQLVLGNRIEAVEAIRKAAKMVQTCGVFSEARSAVEAAQVKMWLIQEDWSEVDHWADTLEKSFGSHDPFRYEDELTQITQARVFMAQNKPDVAIRLLAGLEESAQSGGRQGRLIEILLLKALAFQALGNTSQADIDLTNSLTLAEPEVYVRVFLDEGRPMQVLVNQWLGHSDSRLLRNYACHLLSQFDAKPAVVAGAWKKVSPTNGLIEPLSQRELEVLQLMALGRTNQEIAQQLIVSPGTVKAHTASIYRKLDVANRTEAAARARQLGILL